MDHLSGAFIAAGFGFGIAACGTGLGISLLAGKALEGISRQPEAAGPIQTAMVIAIAFIEAIALYALVICIMLVTKH
jgi:F-type H+-transporting ATPase subunit c